MELQHEEYTLELEKLMISQVASTYWSPTMDLIAIVTYDHILQLYRISFKAQKVFNIQEQIPIKCLCFSSNSKNIAYGLVDGTCKLIKTQNGEKIVVVTSTSKEQLQQMSYLNFCQLQPATFMPFQKDSIEKMPLVQYNLHRNAIIKINYFNNLKEHFFLLLASQRKKTTILVNGFIPIAEINYTEIPFKQFSVLHTHYNTKLTSVIAQQKQEELYLHLVQYKGKGLQELKNDIIKISCLTGYISEIINFIERTYSVAQSLIRDILRQYSNKINLLDDGKSENINPCQELFRYLNFGITSPSLINFLTREIYDSKVLQKLDQTLNTSFAQLHDLMLQSVQNSLEKATVLLKKLINLSKINKYKQLALQTQILIKVQQQIRRLYTMGEIILVESTQAKFDIRNLLVWLNKSTIKSAQDNQTEIQNTKSCLNRYSVDFNRLYNFLANENMFRLEHLLTFFSKEKNTTYPMKMKAPDFRLLTQPKPTQISVSQMQQLQRMEKQLEIEHGPIINQPMVQQYLFHNFKCQMEILHQIWTDVVNESIKRISKLLCQQISITPIGKISITQMFAVVYKFIIIQNNTFVYYVQHAQTHDKLIQYNCQSGEKKWLITYSSFIINIAVAREILCILQDRTTGDKKVAQVVNKNWKGDQIKLGKVITKLQGQLDISCGMRGLNSLVINKNKLVIFVEPQSE